VLYAIGSTEKLPPNLEFARDVIEILILHHRHQGGHTRVPVQEPIEYGIESDGTITARPWLMGILEGADINRFRKCAACGRSFYAKRELSRGCSKRCAAALRKRRSYQLNKERREQYARARARKRKKGRAKK
jgi:hypothetical protein